MKIAIIFIFCFIPVLTKTLSAHGLFLHCNDGQLQVFFGASVPASGVTITLVDGNGIIIHQEKLDENGKWSIPKELNVTPKVIIAESPGGHRITREWNELIQGDATGFFHSMTTRIVLGMFMLIGSSVFMKRFFRLIRGKHD